MLGRADVVPYLVQRGLIAPQAIVDGDVRVVDASRRNRNFHVVANQGSAYLVKQGRHGSQGLGTVAHEAAAYERLTWEDNLGGRPAPRSFGFDHEEAVLVI